MLPLDFGETVLIYEETDSSGMNCSLLEASWKIIISLTKNN